MTKFLVCVCGWRSEAYPDDTIFAGLGGELSCPECTKKKRNRQIEVYGLIHIEDDRGYILCSQCGEWYVGSRGSAHASPIHNWCINCWLKVTAKKREK